jgi:serine/threonine protein phosphatase 1
VATIAIGDIHGQADALEDLLAQLTPELVAADTVVFLGDYIDRGPATRRVIDLVLDFRAHAGATVVALRGNHEDWFLRTLHDPTHHSWLIAMEAFETITSYSAEAADELMRALERTGPRLFTEGASLPYDVFFAAIPPSHIEFFEALRPFHRTADAICVHAGLDSAIGRLDDQPLEACVWGTRNFPQAYNGDDVVVYGHWHNAVLDPDGWPRPRVDGRTIGIDTIAHGVLTAMRLPDQRVFQSRRFPVVGVAV